MYLEKIKVMNMISNKTDLGIASKDIELVEKPELLLEDLKFYFPNFLFYLWEKPDIMAFLIQKAEISDVKNYLAPLVVNNFYENILSSNFIQENLIYILTLLLHEEINNLSSVEQNSKFLDNTCCGFLLEELRKKKDIQSFFKTIIIDSIENLETNYSDLKLNFIVDEMNENYYKNKGSKYSIKNEDIYLADEDQELDGINYRDRKTIQSEQVNFNKKYIPPLEKESIEKFLEENNISDNKIINELYNSQLDKSIDQDQSLYSNMKLLANFNKHKISDKLLYIYQNNFMRVINFINLILEKIILNFNLLPYSIKCFCKIISLMAEKRFPNITESEKIIFVLKFFFCRLLIPILRNPGIEAFINNIIINNNTLVNLDVICNIIKKMVSGEFYNSDKPDELCYTPFNWYFIEKSSQIYTIFEHITRVRLPNFIEDFINNKLPQDFQYNYFEQNQDEVINFRSICFNIHEALALINTMDKCKSEIFNNPESVTIKKTLDRLMTKNSKKVIQKIIDKEKNNTIINDKQKKDSDKHLTLTKKSSSNSLNPFENKPGTKLYYFLFTDLLTNDDYKKLFQISQPTKSFSIKELKDLSNEENVIKNNIIKVKNFICSLLYNFDKLVKTNFDPGTIGNTEKILEELNILMQSSYFVMDGSIPFDWYINSIFEYLQKIPKNLVENDCEELYKEIEEDINNSIKQLDFIKLSVIIEKIEFAERGKIFYKENQKLLSDINLNEEIKKIIQNEFIPVKINFHWEEEDKVKGKPENGIFQIEPSGFKEKDRNNIDKINAYEKSKKVTLALTIENFTKRFPNLLLFQEYEDADILHIQRKLNFPDVFGKYFNIVFKHLESNQYLNKKFQNLDKIKENIFDYVMGKLYDKIFPIEPNKEDIQIYWQTVKLSWIKPNHFLGNKKQYVFGSFLNDIKRFFKQLVLEKSPRKKLLNMDEISNDVSFFYTFNGNNEIGLDDEISLLSYAMIKIQPSILDSNFEFMNLYCKVGGIITEGNKLEQLKAVIEFIKNIQYFNLNGVTQEEFKEECIKAKNPKIN